MFIIPLLIAARLLAADASPVGLWKTVDDKTHKTRGLVRVFEKDGALFGRIESDFDTKEAAEVCTKCDGDRKDKPVVGLTIMRGMKKRDSDYGGGDILDPETGTVYRCKMTLEDGGKRLVVRGFIGISLLGRSQTWFRQE
ncbi:MAG: DUF2147 domain-containing protein [Acidobacteriota bacterium]|nr:DUF2147 domain-containing protein [Acidobacteriota bacterium]